MRDRELGGILGVRAQREKEKKKEEGSAQEEEKRGKKKEKEREVSQLAHVPNAHW